MAEQERILDSITRPSDIHCLSNEELTLLCSEIRSDIIETTSSTGGHVAASLGAVELIVAAHSILNVPHDKLLFDVGHQSYAHMLLCGRAKSFKTLRQFGGFAGFPRPSVSKYDSSVSGHASDSISVAAGYAHANMLNKSDSKVVAIIGDASIEGGMALEALGYIGANQLPVIIILNDNGMSISKPVGAVTRHLGNVRTSKQYRSARDEMQRRLEKSGFLGKWAVEAGFRAKESMRNILFPHATLFEKMGVMCTPPIDGNNVGEVKEMLDLVLDVGGPVLIHTITKKGKGYVPAEKDPETFHGISSFNLATGEKLKKKRTPYWTDVFGEEIVKIAEENDDVVAITAAMEGGCGLKDFHTHFPNRYIDVGIAEENAVGMASGLSLAGKIPFVCIYSTFLQRAYDQILTDICIENQHVIFAIDRAGLVGADGPTHHGLFDIAYLRSMPNMTILCPSDEHELKLAMRSALQMTGPVAIRYPRGETIESLSAEVKDASDDISNGKSRKLAKGKDGAILSFGKMTKDALKVREFLADKGLKFSVVDMRFAKPLDKSAVLNAVRYGFIVTLEDGILQGGAGEAIGNLIGVESGQSKCRILNFAIDNKFVEHGSDKELQNSEGLDPETIAKKIFEELKK